MSKQCDARYIEWVMQLAQSTISLNTPIADTDEEIELEDILVDPDPTPEERAMEAVRRENLLKYLNKFLSERECEVIKMRFGFYDNKPMTLQDVADEFGLTRERVRQIEAKALRKLRNRFMANKITWENI